MPFTVSASNISLNSCSLLRVRYSKSPPCCVPTGSPPGIRISFGSLPAFATPPAMPVTTRQIGLPIHAVAAPQNEVSKRPDAHPPNTTEIYTAGSCNGSALETPPLSLYPPSFQFDSDRIERYSSDRSFQNVVSPLLLSLYF